MCCEYERYCLQLVRDAALVTTFCSANVALARLPCDPIKPYGSPQNQTLNSDSFAPTNSLRLGVITDSYDEVLVPIEGRPEGIELHLEIETELNESCSAVVDDLAMS